MDFQLRELLKCNRCTDKFTTNGANRPVMFSCGHTFCFNCINVKPSNCFECNALLSRKNAANNFELVQFISDKSKPQCSICMNSYKTDGDHCPFVLLCGHSFCRLCIFRLQSGNGGTGFRVLCSLCRYLLVYDSEIPKNYSLIEILHILYGIPFLKLNIEQLVIFLPEDTEKSLLLKLNDLYLTISKVFAVFSTYSVRINRLTPSEELLFSEQQIHTKNEFKMVKEKFEKCFKKILNFFKNQQKNRNREKLESLLTEIHSMSISNRLIEDIQPKVSELARDSDNIYNFPQLYSVREKMKTNNDVKFKDILRATFDDTIRHKCFCAKIGIIGRVNIGKSSLSNTIRKADPNSSDWSPVDSTACTPLPLHHLYKHQYENQELNICYVDFPGYDIDNLDDYINSVKKAHFDIIILAYTDRGDDRLLKSLERINPLIVCTKADQYFSNKYVDIYDEPYDKNNPINDRVELIIDSIRGSTNYITEQVYYIGCSRYNTLNIDFDKEKLLNDIYERAYQIGLKYHNSRKRLESILEYGNEIIKTLVGNIKIDTAKEVIKASVAGFIPFLDIVFVNKSKNKILEEIGLNDDLKQYIKFISPYMRLPKTETEWFKELGNHLIKITGVVGGVIISIADDVIKVAGIILPKALGIPIAVASAILTPIISGGLAYREINKFTESTRDDMLKVYEAFIEYILQPNYGTRQFLFFNQLFYCAFSNDINILLN